MKQVSFFAAETIKWVSFLAAETVTWASFLKLRRRLMQRTLPHLRSNVIKCKKENFLYVVDVIKLFL